MTHCSGLSPYQAESPFTHLWLLLQLQPAGAPTPSKFSTTTPTGKTQRRDETCPRLHSTSVPWLGLGAKGWVCVGKGRPGCWVGVPNKLGPKS